MAKKLLSNELTPPVGDGCVVTLVTDYPISLTDDTICVNHSIELISIVASGVIETDIVLYSSNCPYIFGKGGKINVSS